ncbi:DUF294 nucleotidyltransferase-like domain-containing protein [Noviherbaspirillum sedimenti]|uniref:CBS domain-containing protein n=1 Tax=Noviherbaspirillum sedimenti TaxID=2320865 RepID=A0A3A3G8R1_9BURK|nr:DUF294 nucleotidyltransferase-like domain-containing protein [Noviherbaspirillum sedimenti]RJG04194.1 hypothetical protein D3878_03315 [Noviherbaspirillum sedimenti]
MEKIVNLDLDAAFGNNTAAARGFARDLDRVRLALAEANDSAAMQKVAAELRALARRALEMAPAEVLTRLISALNDALTRRVIALVCAQAQMSQLAPSDWCWIALGSEGRQEQTFVSDQDNGIIFADCDDPDARRAQLLPLALRINLMLADCGFALCRGNIMASNPQCCLSLHEWRGRFLAWMIEGDPQALLNATIFFDFRPLHGAAGLAHTLCAWLAANAADNPRFLLQMSENALRREAPLGLLRDFAVEKNGPFAGTIDLKLQAATLFVDAARVFCLACGSYASNTADRLRLAAQEQLLDASEAAAWIQAFYFIQRLRLTTQHASDVRGEDMHNHVDPARLAVADRRALLAALRQTRTLQQHLALAHPGSGREG